MEKIQSALTDFIVRVSRGETTSEKETEILPEVVKILRELLVF